MALIAIVLLGGAAVRLVLLVVGLVRLRRLRSAGRPVAIDNAGAAEVRFVAGLRQPVTFGLRRPVVLLPAGLESARPDVRLAVLEHELWHVRRRDWLWVMVEEVTRALLWFHPAIIWLIGRVQLTREEVVDELTVLSTNARRSYLEALLTFADEPPLFPAAPFARRRHLFQRMLLIAREAAMSSRRIVTTCAAMGAIVLAGAWYGVWAFPLTAGTPLARAQQTAPGQPRDLRPGEPRPASQREITLQAELKAKPSVTGYVELARLQESRGAVADAEATLKQGQSVLPGERTLSMGLAGLYARTGRFDDAMKIVEGIGATVPSDPSAQFVIATFYEEKVRKDSRLSGQERGGYIRSGLAATERALSLSPDFVDAMIIRNLLLREQAQTETNAAARAQMIAEADQLRSRAQQMQFVAKQGNGGTPGAGARPGGMPPPPPPPPPPGAASTEAGMAPPPPPPPPPDGGTLIDGMAPIRVGGNIKPPTKIHDVRPVYPPMAMDAGVTGVVIAEVGVDGTGAVATARILKSIPLLDEAALDAIKEWRFTPTLLNGAPVPVIMTVTVNFTLK
jgi:TonB family protein